MPETRTIGKSETTKWTNPETRRKAAQRARDRANAAKWSLDVALFLVGVVAIVLILTSGRASIGVIASVALLGLAMAWLVGWRRARQVYGRFLDEELARYPDDWQDYYKILRIGPNAESSTITEAYERLSHIFSESLSDEAKGIRLYSQMKKDIDEAFQVLSDAFSRASYDYIFWLKCNANGVGIAESTKYELVSLSQSISAKLSETIRGITWKIPLFDRVPRQAVLGAVVALLAMLLGGTSLAFAKPEHTLAAPFRGIAITLTETSAGAVGLIEDVRGIIASYERQIVSTALQELRVDESLKQIPAVKASTNDMSRFPSQEHPLFPGYLETRFSQFKYTVSDNGIVTVYTSGATTDAFLDKIKRLLNRLEEGK